MTTPLEAAARQALEALEKCDSALAEELAAWDIDPPLQHVLDASNACGPAITALRSALEQQAAQEPVSTRTIGDTRRARDAGYAAGVASSLPNKITAEMRSAFREGYKGGSIWTDRLDRALECMLAAAPQQAAQEPAFCIYCGGNDETPQEHCTDCERPIPTKDRIREIFMAHSFTVKEGHTDLKPYVYEAAYALLNEAPQQAAEGRQPLTEEEIDALIQQHVDPVATYRKMHQFARAVEDAAHGIKGGE